MSITEQAQIRLGFILPSVNTLAEPWFHRVCPSSASVHTTRMSMPDALTPESLIAMDHEDGPVALAQILSCRPTVVGYACVASSVVQGPSYDRSLAQQMSSQSGRPCVTAMGSIVDALRIVRATKLTLISPYASAVAMAERTYLEAEGFEIVSEYHLGINSAFDLASPSQESIVEAALKYDTPAADAILLSCMNFAGHLVIEEIERRTEKPVIAASQALLWKMLRVAGICGKIIEGGKLFDEALLT
ncbi:maleate cis-trans isomerase family protein [Pseudomonas fluorescens]|uniref:maleate cis-trans isomerase family protein n=1 Tax=Pseudomonas fluorescens TaxID=294 RepID=UPI003F9DA555